MILIAGGSSRMLPALHYCHLVVLSYHFNIIQYNSNTALFPALHQDWGGIAIFNIKKCPPHPPVDGASVFVLTCGVQPLLSISVGDQTLLLADISFEGGASIQHSLLITLQRDRTRWCHQSIHQSGDFDSEATAPVHAIHLQTWETDRQFSV